jgi:hypothetical protein
LMGLGMSGEIWALATDARPEIDTTQKRFFRKYLHLKPPARQRYASNVPVGR